MFKTVLEINDALTRELLLGALAVVQLVLNILLILANSTHKKRSDKNGKD